MAGGVRDAREFLEEVGLEMLLQRGVIRRYGDKLYLRKESIWDRKEDKSPILQLMSDSEVGRLEYSGPSNMGWYLDSEGNYCNPRIKREHGPRTGKVWDDLANPGSIFDGQNKPGGINSFISINAAEGSEELVGSHPRNARFSKESDLQQALRYDIEQLEQGLTIADGGREPTVRSGRPDIMAKDSDGTLVAIELKPGEAKSLTQLESYMRSLRTGQEKVRGILVAHDFHQHVVVAAEDKADISLKAYTIRLTFEDR